MRTTETVRASASEADQKLIQLVLDVKERTSPGRWVFERDWFRNILFYVGQQWITYQEGARRWRLRNMPLWVPLPVTNRLSSTANTIRSAVAQVIPSFTATPTQENEKSVLSANAADKYLDVILRESGFRGARRRLASWVTMTGNGFLLTEFDNSEDTGTVLVPGERCLDCDAKTPPNKLTEDLHCPNCGSDNLVEDESVGQNIPQGRVTVRSPSPFEVYIDQSILELEDQPAVLLIETRSIESVQQMYKEKAEEVRADADRETGRYFLDSLSQMTSTGLGVGSHSGSRLESDDKGGLITIYRLFIKTCKDYPDGIYVVMSGDQHILEKSEPYPHRYKLTKRPFYPLVHVRYDDVPGRFWAKTPIDDLVPKQRQRNEMESLFQTITMRCANPVWLLPSGVQASPITGDPGIMVKYTPMGGQKPERIPGMEVPVSVIKFIEQIDQDFEEIANTFAVMKGKNPGSVRAASAIQMLLERGFGRYGSVFDNLEESYETWAVQALEIWRQKAIFPRVQAIAQSAGSWQFMEFLGADLGEVDIRVEAGSTRPKSQAGRQMMVQQALQWGLVNPNDPEQRLKLSEELGMTHLLMGAEADTKIVAEENMQFMKWAQEVTKALKEEEGEPLVDPQAVVMLLMQTFPIKGDPILDHHPTHVVHHRRFALTEQFRALPEVIRQLFVQHILVAHYPYLVQEAMTGMGPTGVMAGILQNQAARGQNTPGGGRSQRQGGGPGGATEGPFGSEKGTGGPSTSQQGTG